MKMRTIKSVIIYVLMAFMGTSAVAAGTTTIDVCSGSTSYSTISPLRQRITVTVAPPVADVVVSNAVFVANGRTAVLTNDVGQTIAWNVCTNSVSGDEKIAKVIKKDERVAVSCTTGMRNSRSSRP